MSCPILPHFLQNSWKKSKRPGQSLNVTRAVQAITNSDDRVHSAPRILQSRNFLDIFQVNTFEIAKCMFYYKDNCIAPIAAQSNGNK